MDQDIAQNSDFLADMSFEHELSKHDILAIDPIELDPENNEDLATSIRDSINKDARQSERDELESVYSELDQSMQ
jgi:hypothetical protein